MLKEDLYLEDLILCLAGVAPIDEDLDLPKLAGSDVSLIHSFAKQIIRNLGFTDKQNELAQRKVTDYQDYFSFLSNLAEIKNKNRIPIRSIDRSRWIKIIENSKGDYEIAVRFTFQKKLISAIEEIRSTLQDRGAYDKETKVHCFEYSERSLFVIVNAFKNNHFELDPLVEEIYNKLDTLNPDDVVPGVYNYEIKNLHQNGTKAILEELGEPSKDNILLYKDRSFKYGLTVVNNFDNIDKDSLPFKIASRKSPNVRINSDKVQLDSLILALEDLNRFPVLIVLPVEGCYDLLVEMQEFIRNLIPNKQVSVLFRLDNNGEGLHFNDYIREQKINNKLDKSTKIVYCLDNKLPKPMLNSAWEPRTIFLFSAKPVSGRKVLEYYSSKDLIIHYQDAQLPVHYYYRTDIEGIS